MTPEQLREFYDSYFYYIILGGVVFGLIVGIVPLVLGIKKGNRNLGLIAIVSVAILGALSPLLCLIVAIVFSVIIVVRSKHKVSVDSDEPPAANSSD